MWDISFPKIKNKAAGLLIGVDHCKLLTPLESRFGPEGGPDAIRTSLGWVLYGPIDSNLKFDNNQTANVLRIAVQNSPNDVICCPYECVQPGILLRGPNCISAHERESTV